MQLFENFISYRRSETLPEVQNIYYALTSKGYSTFCDIYSLNNGRFDDNLLKTIERCTNYILVLNNNSLNRCSEDEDWLRFEIETALKNKKNIVCVFVGDVTFPEKLPSEIDDIRFYNGIKYDFLYFNGFIDTLCSRFLVKEGDTKVSNANRDFVISELTLVKYIGNAPIVNIPDQVKVIGDYAFKDKTQITEVNFPNGLEEIGDHAFERCISISCFIFPETLKKIGSHAFMRCFNLSFVAFNDGLETIGEYAFSFCGKLKLARFGKNVKDIAASAFNDCDKLAVFDVDLENENYSSVDGILYNKLQTSIIRCPEGYENTLINVGNNVEKIGPWCFSKCLNLVDVILPRHIRIIGAYAFNDCRNIVSLTLGDDVEEFDDTAIAGWDRRQRIVVSNRFNPLIKYKIDQRISEKESIKQEEREHLPEFIVVKTTFESVEEASKMSKMLLSRHYIASAQLDELNVFYTWNNEACNENEIELSCITRGDLYKEVETFIKKHHSYECCQIIGLPIVSVSEDFADWIREQTQEE